jgi:hypothetical protein
LSYSLEPVLKCEACLKSVKADGIKLDSLALHNVKDAVTVIGGDALCMGHLIERLS